MNSYHDGNGVPTLIAVENDGITLVNIEANPSTHELNTSDGTSGSNNGPSGSFHDSNHVPILVATSSADGTTPVIVYGNSSNDLLTKST